MKYIKHFERFDEYPLEIGDYVKVDQDILRWIKAGIYGKINSKIFEIIEIDDTDDTYLLDIIMDWCRRDQLEKVTDIDEINEYKIKKDVEKFNI